MGISIIIIKKYLNLEYKKIEISIFLKTKKIHAHNNNFSRSLILLISKMVSFRRIPQPAKNNFIIIINYQLTHLGPLIIVIF